MSNQQACGLEAVRLSKSSENPHNITRYVSVKTPNTPTRILHISIPSPMQRTRTARKSPAALSLPLVASTSVAEEPRVSLFSLPLELREMVYEYVFSSDAEPGAVHLHVYNQMVSQCLFKESPRVGRSIAALLQTCHSIHDEAVRILYNNTRFEIALYPKTGEACYSLEGGKSQSHKFRVLGKLSGLIKSFNRMRSMLITANLSEVGRDIAAPRLTPFLIAIGYEKHSKSLDVRVNLLWDSDLSWSIFVAGVDCVTLLSLLLEASTRCDY